MKVFLIGYLNKNLGDDLFYDILINRYKNVMFYTFSSEIYLNYPNLKIIKLSPFKKIINKFLKLVTFKKIDLYSIYANKCDIVVVIGGSMFIESDYLYRINYYNTFKVPYFIIGANVGPYKTERYLNFIRKNIFENAIDVSLRDINSYKLFSNMKNVRYNPDIVFSYDIKKNNINKNNKNKVIISIIDIKEKKSQVQCISTQLYDKLIIDIVNFFKQNKYIIEFFSFCSNEGDSTAIKRIKTKLNYNIEEYIYDGNIKAAIEELSSASTIVGTRFHANIIGFILNKNVIPIIYNNKTKNLLEDLQYKGVYFDLNDIKKMDASILKTEDLKYKINIFKEKNNSRKHFEKLDKFMRNKKNGEK